MSSSPLPADRHGLGETRPGAGASVDRVLLAVLGAAILLYFVVRGWLGATLVLLGIACMASSIVHFRETARDLRDHRVRWLAVAFVVPVLAALLVNAGHQQTIPRSFDAAVRFVLAFAIFLDLRRRGIDFAPLARLVFPAAIALCAAMVLLAPFAASFYWGGRVATYFMDPIILCQHVMVSGFLCLFLIDPRAPGAHWKAALAVIAACLAVLVALGTQSRSGWLMVPVLATVLLLRGRRVTPLQVSSSIAVVLLACWLAYGASDVIRMRVDQVGIDIGLYLDGTDRNTSVGLRLSLYRTALILFAERPWLGWGFGPLPAIDAMPAVAGFYTPALHSYFVGAGVHNEFLQAMVRMGVVGLASRVLLYAIPLWIFVAAIRSPWPLARQNGYLGLVVVVGYVTAGLTTEVTNLIYAASFYGLLVAVFAAGAMPREPR